MFHSFVVFHFQQGVSVIFVLFLIEIVIDSPVLDELAQTRILAIALGRTCASALFAKANRTRGRLHTGRNGVLGRFVFDIVVLIVSDSAGSVCNVGFELVVRTVIEQIGILALALQETKESQSLAWTLRFTNALTRARIRGFALLENVVRKDAKRSTSMGALDRALVQHEIARTAEMLVARDAMRSGGCVAVVAVLAQGVRLEPRFIGERRLGRSSIGTQLLHQRTVVVFKQTQVHWIRKLSLPGFAQRQNGQMNIASIGTDCVLHEPKLRGVGSNVREEIGDINGR